MKKLLLSLAILLSFSALAQPTFEWAQNMGSTGSDQGYSITTDASGNVYTTGDFQNTVDFDPGAGTFNLASNGSNDIFIQKLDANGNFIWAKSMGSTAADYGFSITTDASGNVYTTGKFQGTVDFDPSGGTLNLIAVGSADGFIQKLDAGGNFLWAIGIGGAGIEWGVALTTDISGNVYVTGGFSGTVDFDPGAGTFNLTSNGSYDGFIQKLDAGGNFLWAKSVGGTGDEYFNSISIDGSGNVLVTGGFDETVDFDPGAGVFNLTNTSLFGLDVFILKLDASGGFIWATEVDGTSSEEGNSIVTDASNNVYVAGHFGNTVDFDPGAGNFDLATNGGFDVFVLKLDANGTFIWAKSMGGIGADIGYSITTDASGNVYTTGYFQNTVDFDPGAGTFNLASNGSADVFIQKLDANGNFIWAKSMGGSVNDVGKSITTDVSGNVYTTGWFENTVDFDPGAGTFNLASNGSWDIFIQKLSESGVGIIENDFGNVLLIYPNPTFDQVTLQGLETLSSIKSIYLTDAKGSLVRVCEVDSETIDLTALSIGLYYINIDHAKGTERLQIVRQ